eukprot:sb/3472467/
MIAAAPIGCAPSKGFLKTHPASPGGSFRPFQRDDNNTVAMATELLCAHYVFYEGALSPRYRLTNDFDVHLQLIIEISQVLCQHCTHLLLIVLVPGLTHTAGCGCPEPDITPTRVYGSGGASSCRQHVGPSKQNKSKSIYRDAQDPNKSVGTLTMIAALSTNKNKQ